METVDTARLRLRPLSEDDVDDLVQLDGELDVRRWVDPFGTIIPADPVDRRRYERERFVDRGGFYGARERVGGAFVGWFQLEASRDRPGEAELGYRLRRSAWGIGYATEGARALVEHALAVGGFRRVYAHALNDNAASIRVLEKAGLRYVGPWSYRGLPGAEYAVDRPAFGDSFGEH